GAVCPSTPGAPSLRVRWYASTSQTRSGWWLSDVNAICGACLASSAIRCCFVDTVPGFDAPAMFPSNDSATRRLLPSAGFPRVGFPDFVGVGSEEARSVALTLASVRRSNGACGFPALRFHKGTLQA